VTIDYSTASAAIVSVGFLFACASIAGVDVKPCRPGCVDAETALVCDGGTARAVKCPGSSEPCAAPSCHDGDCGYRPHVGAPCGPDGLATCNEGYACLGPRTKLSAMRLHTCALADDGKVWCWGDNPYGELGDGTITNNGYVAFVPLPRPAIDVDAGYSHTCAVLDDGTVYCWGNNEYGKSVPTSSAFNVSEPTRVDAPGVHFTQVSSAEDHTCAITEESKVFCWGRTSEGQCGVDGAAMNVDSVGPTEVPGLDNVRTIESGLVHTCALRRGTPGLLCWGSNRSGNGGYIDGKLGPAAEGLDHSATPIPVDLGLPPIAKGVDVPILAVGIGYESTYAVAANNITYAWGSNADGQLGVEDQSSVVNTPGPVVTLDDMERRVPLNGVAEVLRSDATDQCVEMHDLSVAARYLCWGRDDYGELGMGMGMYSVTVQFPTAMTVLPESAANLVRGEQHSCFTAVENGVVEIECFGRKFVVANGTTDRVGPQLLPSPVRWDLDRFERLLAR
jgi:alpha-tubulin suppressor-like RCC1 family protein